MRVVLTCVALLSVCPTAPASGQDRGVTADAAVPAESSPAGSGESPQPAKAPTQASGQPPTPAQPPPPPQQPTPDRPLSRLFPNLLQDLRRYPSTSSAVALGIGGAAAAAVYPMDAHVTTHATAGGTDQLFAVGGMIGGGYVQAGGALASFIVGHYTHSPRLRHTGADLIRGQAANALVTHALKLGVRRARPGGAPGHLPATYSFPSAHASASWTTATVVWRHFGWRAGVPASVLASYVSGSRVQQGQHFLSDVVFGAALGITAGRTVTIGHGGPAFALAPLVVRGGGGVALSLSPGHGGRQPVAGR